MSQEEKAGERPPTKLGIQLRLIEESLREKDIEVASSPGVPREDGDLDYLYQPGVILVRDAYLGQVRELLGGGEVRAGFTGGVTLYSLEGSAIPNVPEALELTDARLGVGVAAPNHIMSITPVWPCPAAEPVEVPRYVTPDPGVCGGGGSGVSVYIADTGLLAGAADHHPWLAGVTGAPDPLTVQGGQTIIPGYAGHGTFVAGVARCMAPGAAVHVSNDFTAGGALSEFEIVLRLHEALRRGADVISLSAGGTTRKDLPPLGFEGFWNTYRHYKNVVMVAAAGNNSLRRPFWPAAFPQVVGVGALSANGRSRAYFSDFGPWVDVYAPGEDLINAYASGTYVCREPPHIGRVRHFHGMASWSGTSFATPLVAGLIAARMSATGEDGRRAARALLKRARAGRVPGTGPVLRPCETGCPGTTRGCGCGGRCGDAHCGGACCGGAG
jgi:subtilisin family serine protease